MERYNEGLFTYFFGLVIYFRVHMQQLIVVVHHYPRQDSRIHHKSKGHYPFYTQNILITYEFFFYEPH